MNIKTFAIAFYVNGTIIMEVVKGKTIRGALGDLYDHGILDSPVGGNSKMNGMTKKKFIDWVLEWKDKPSREQTIAIMELPTSPEVVGGS